MRIKISESAQRSLIKSYWKEAKEVLYKSSLPVLQASDNMTPQALKARLEDLVKPDQMEKYLTKLWTKVGAKFANDTERLIIKRKSLEEPRLDDWEEGFRMYAADRSKQLARKIVKTQIDYLTSAIDKIIHEAGQNGEAITTIAGKLKDQFEKDMIVMQRYEAERIARTEVIGASNKGSFDGAKATGLDLKKEWLTSGLPGVRDTHMSYEARGPIEMDREFGPNLQHPGDPNGAPEEIINCRCTITYITE